MVALPNEPPASIDDLLAQKAAAVPNEPRDGTATVEPRDRAPSRAGAKAARRAEAASAREPAATSRQPPAGKWKLLETKLQEHITLVGVTVSVYNQADGAAILTGGERLAGALTRLAQENKSVERLLNTTMIGSAWAEVLFAVGAITLPIAANHDMMPKGILPFAVSE